MTEFIFHFSTREYYRVVFEAECLEEAKEMLEYYGVSYQNVDRSGFLEDNNISYEDEDYDNDAQWVW